MKNLLFVILLLIVGNINLNSQETYILLSGGLTKPVSDFADDNFDNENAGFATNGYNFGFELSNFFNPWFGVGGSFKFNNSGFDSQKYDNSLQQNYGNQYDTIGLNSGDYTLQNFLIGPYGKLDLGNHISIIGKLFIGILSTKPDQSLVYRNFGDLDNSYLLSEEKLKGAFTWNYGAGVLLKFNERMGVIVMVDYISANPKFDKFDYLTMELTQYKSPVKYLNLNIGIALGM